MFSSECKTIRDAVEEALSILSDLGGEELIHSVYGREIDRVERMLGNAVDEVDYIEDQSEEEETYDDDVDLDEFLEQADEIKEHIDEIAVDIRKLRNSIYDAI